ncbi:hypothetical protein [Streptomyces koyangensis]
MLGAFGPAGEMGKMISGERVEVRLAGGEVLTWSTVRAGSGPGGRP